jgi:mRNA-degrading endonuclease RelE of RelBE toxin-antitoxin system
MRTPRVKLTPEAGALLTKFHPENKKQIKAAIKELRQGPDAGGDLQEQLSGFKSFKSKRYRIIYKLNEDENAIEIFYIGHRRDVYDQFRRLLTQLT